MAYQATTALKKIRALTKRLKIIQGGSSAGKTIAILLILIDRLQKERGKISSVVSETVPHLRRGAIRDFQNIMEAHHYWRPDRWHETTFTYEFETGSRLEFFSADSPDKVRGPRRNGDLFINECNNVSYETYTQLAIRTEGDIFLDYNPVVEFWVQDEIVSKGIEHDFLKLTYKDNEGLPDVIVKDLESRKGNAAWWRVYGEGEIGFVEGRVYHDWNIIDDIPHEARLECHALDLGFSPDPAAIIDVYWYNGGWILDEVLHQRGLHNSDLANVLKNLPSKQIVGDSAEPKSLMELAQYGLSVIPAQKGKDSKRWGISVLQSERISVTKRSVNLIDEYRKYMLDQDVSGRFIPGVTVGKDDCLDAARYGITSRVGIIRRKELLDFSQIPRVRKEARNPAR